MDYSQLAFLLAAIGLGLLAAEFFIPSGGLIFIMASLSLIISLWCAWQAWWTTDRTLWWSYLGTLVVLIPLGVAFVVYIMPRTAMGRQLFVAPQSSEELTPYQEEEKHLNAMIDRVGKTLTRLTPGGLVSIDGERLHCESEGMMLDPGTDVRVVSVKGNRLCVRAITLDSDTTEDASDTEDPGTTKPWLDFDLPSG